MWTGFSQELQTEPTSVLFVINHLTFMNGVSAKLNFMLNEKVIVKILNPKLQRHKAQSKNYLILLN